MALVVAWLAPAAFVLSAHGAWAQAAPPPPAKPDPSPVQPPAPSGTSAIVMDLSAIQSVIGKSVRSSSGEDLGRIVDLLVTPSGQIRAAVIDFGGVLGVGSRKVAVDWKALDFATFMKDGNVRLALTRDQVRVSPEYKAGDPVVILQASKPDEPKPPVAAAPKPLAAAAGPTPAHSSQPPQTPASQSAPTSPPQGEAHKQ